jgi:Nif-specific regulatory protein
MPSLRERREDIPLLANYFARKYAEKCNRRVIGISPDARRLLEAYDWPGNVRELENAIERAVVMGSTDYILTDDLPESVLEHDAMSSSGESSSYHEQVVQMKKQMIIDAMKQCSGSYTAAAKMLHLHPNYLHRLIRNLNLKDQLR